MLDLLAQAAQQVQGDPDLIRPYISLDWDDLGAVLLGAGALFTALRMKRSSIKQVTKNETVDADVLSQFLGLTDRVANLEGMVAALQLELADTKLQLAGALQELTEMQKVEEYLRARLHEKDQELQEVRDSAALKQEEIERLQGRVKHLEEVCKRAGINGDDV